MKLFLSANVLAVEERVNSKGMPYTLYLLQNGVDVLKIMSSSDLRLEVDKHYKLVVYYNAQYKSLKITGISK